MAPYDSCMRRRCAVHHPKEVSCTSEYAAERAPKAPRTVVNGSDDGSDDEPRRPPCSAHPAVAAASAAAAPN